VAEALPSNRVGIAISRGILAGSMTTFGPVRARTAVTVVNERTEAGQVRGEWVRARGARREDAAVLYVHGSGYALCSPRTHRGLTSRLSAFTGLPVFSLDYRLAPRHRFPAAADDVARAFGWLVGHGFAADRIVVAGDSAGAHLAVDLCLSLLRSGRALPAAQLLLSPIVDLSLALAAEREQVRPDPMISAAGARRLIDLYTEGADLAHERLAVTPRPGEVLPPTLIQAGGREMLAADAHALHQRLTETGTVSRLEVWPGQVHVFQAMPRLVPEADPALRRAATFLREAVPVTNRQPLWRTA
jgi:monoterpene epsilon-lactone hydrolase